MKDLGLLNQSSRVVQVNDVRIVCPADTPNAPVFQVMSPLPFDVGVGQRFGVEVKYTGTERGTLTGVVEVDCDLPIGPTLLIPLAASVTANRHAELRLTPTSLALGNAPVGTVVEKNLTITNVGFYDAALTIQVLPDQPAGPFAVHPSFPASALPTSLAPTKSVVLRVLYQPTTSGASRATLVIGVQSRTDALTTTFNNRYVIPLDGTARMPTIFIAGGPQRWVSGLDGVLIPARESELKVLDFGVAAPSTAGAASFWVRNVGDALLTVNGVVVYNQGYFGVNNVTIFPATLQTNGEMEVPCSFGAPPVSGMSVSGEFRVLSDDPLQPSAVLNATGKAAGPHLAEPSGLLRLGIVPPAPASATIIFRSDGTEAVILEKVELGRNTGFSVSGAPRMSARLAPGTELTLTVTLTAIWPGDYQDQLLVIHDGKTSQVVINGTVARITIAGVARWLVGIWQAMWRNGT